jgi:hypothetical protein
MEFPMHKALLTSATVTGLVMGLSGCGPYSPPAYPDSPAPHQVLAPATINGKVTPSYGSSYNPETGLMNEGQ